MPAQTERKSNVLKAESRSAGFIRDFEEDASTVRPEPGYGQEKQIRWWS